MKDLLKFVTCGSVDDGKSTLLGHMLYDAKLLYTDQRQALELDSRIGNKDGRIDYSLLLDGLMAEREQGITIDVAYRYFHTQNRSFIAADAPGHEEYTRNMAVGASFAQLALILVDASRGILVQTKRHIRICILMGIRHFVFAVNKMDLLSYNRESYLKIQKELEKIIDEISSEAFQKQNASAAVLPYESVYILPVSAAEGDNITKKSGNMTWFEGCPLLEYLETVDVTYKNSGSGFMMPVQRVVKPQSRSVWKTSSLEDTNFRGFQGQIENGLLHTGEEITALPSREKAKVEEIFVTDRKVETAVTGQAVTLRLDKEIDISRGSVLVTGKGPEVSSMCTAVLLWMDEVPLLAGKNYYIKVGTKMLPATVMSIKYSIDVNTGMHLPAQQLQKNEIACCDLVFSEKTVFTSFEQSKALGGFLLIDRIGNQTAACGVIRHSLRRSDNLTWQETTIGRKERSEQKGQSPKTLWFTGLSGAGKTTLANEIEKRLWKMGKHTMLLDGDNVRMGLNKNLGFKEQDRIENIRRVSEVAKLFNDAGLIVLASFISPFERDRENAREIIGRDDFIEIYVSTSLKECERRDVKGLYRKARAGEIPNFTGIGSPYEVPENPDIVINTEGKSLSENADDLMRQLEKWLL